MKLSTKSRYAAEALFYMTISGHGEPLSLSQVSSGTGISENYLEQIAFRLRKAGLLSTRRGTGGGFYLSEPPEQITIGRIVRALEDSVVPVSCVADLSKCESKIRGSCVTRGLWITVSEEIGSVLDSLTLADLKTQYEKESSL